MGHSAGPVSGQTAKVRPIENLVLYVIDNFDDRTFNGSGCIYGVQSQKLAGSVRGPVMTLPSTRQNLDKYAI